MTAVNLERDLNERNKTELKQFLERLLDVQSVLNAHCYFVGGCVRDHLLGQVSYDYDLAVDGDLGRLIQILQENYDLKPSILGTAKVRFGDYHVDLATFRSEQYNSNNGLPEIAPGDSHADLNRRDFTINTGYVLLSYENLDKMLRVDDATDIEMTFAHPKFHDDIQNRILRVLHERSFLEDPSRMMRAIKYMTLNHLKMDDTTQTLFHSAIDKKVIESYSKDRYRQIVLGYARHEQGIVILSNLYENALLLRLNDLDSNRIQAYADKFENDFENDMDGRKFDRGILYLLLMYEYQLDFWIGADRRISELAKACMDLLDIVASAEVSQWQSKWWGYQTFKRFDPCTLNFARLAVSVPEVVKSALHIYSDETHFIKLGITGNTLKNHGLESGKIMGELLNLLLAYKVESGLDMTQEEEIKWIESKRYEY